MALLVHYQMLLTSVIMDTGECRQRLTHICFQTVSICCAMLFLKMWFFFLYVSQKFRSFREYFLKFFEIKFPVKMWIFVSFFYQELKGTFLKIEPGHHVSHHSLLWCVFIKAALAPGVHCICPYCIQGPLFHLGPRTIPRLRISRSDQQNRETSDLQGHAGGQGDRSGCVEKEQHKGKREKRDSLRGEKVERAMNQQNCAVSNPRAKREH